MKLCFSSLFVLIIIGTGFSQDQTVSPSTISKLPGTVYIRDGESVTGLVAYYGSKVYVYTEGGKKNIETYEAKNIIGFALQNGGGEFVSATFGKKGKSKFYEILTPKNMALYLLTPSTTIDQRNKPKETNPLKNNTKYYLYSPAEKGIVSSNFDELSTFMKTRCKGISDAIEDKNSNYYYGMMASDDKIRQIFLKIIDDYTAGRCTYLHRDY